MTTFKVIQQLTEAPALKKPISFAVGTFDGVHLGHQHLIKTLKKYGTSVLFTFNNQPQELVKPDVKIPLLTPPEYKRNLLKAIGIELCIEQEFTRDMANMSYQYFLTEIKKEIPFDHIFFGGDDPIGNNREGTKDRIVELSKTLDFTPHYLPKLAIDGEVVSSSLIRALLQKGNFAQAEKYLGRPFAIYTPLHHPYVDPDLIKNGTYNLKVQTEKDTLPCQGKVLEDGTILFNRPSFIDEKSHATITFLKD